MADQQPILASANPSETNSLAASTSTPAGPVWNCYLTHHKLSDRAASAKWAKRLTKNTSFRTETRYDPASTEHWIFRQGEMALWTSINQTMKDLVAEKVDERRTHQRHHSHHIWSPESDVPCDWKFRQPDPENLEEYPPTDSSAEDDDDEDEDEDEDIEESSSEPHS